MSIAIQWRPERVVGRTEAGDRILIEWSAERKTFSVRVDYPTIGGGCAEATTWVKALENAKDLIRMNGRGVA